MKMSAIRSLLPVQRRCGSCSAIFVVALIFYGVMLRYVLVIGCSSQWKPSELGTLRDVGSDHTGHTLNSRSADSGGVCACDRIPEGLEEYIHGSEDLVGAGVGAARPKSVLVNQNTDKRFADNNFFSNLLQGLTAMSDRRKALKRLLFSPEGGLCSARSSLRGAGQKVVSYTLFGDPFDPGQAVRYFKQVWQRLQEVHSKYQGWVVRIHYDPAVTGHDVTALLLKHISCCAPHVDLCDVTRLPADPHDLRSLQPVGTLWRFVPMLDPLVDAVLSRDLDSAVLDREVDAVREFLASGRTFHVMRDHPYHRSHILAGLWGVNLRKERSLVQELMSDVLLRRPRDNYDLDQILLSTVVWPRASQRMMVHDSYHCRNIYLSVSDGWRPFPAQRHGQNYTGFGPTKLAESRAITKCPQICRPKLHQDWIAC